MCWLYMPVDSCSAVCCTEFQDRLHSAEIGISTDVETRSPRVMRLLDVERVFLQGLRHRGNHFLKTVILVQQS